MKNVSHNIICEIGYGNKSTSGLRGKVLPKSRLLLDLLFSNESDFYDKLRVFTMIEANCIE